MSFITLNLTKFFFVDFEFAGIGNGYFDLANHFCEWSGLDFDFSLFPAKHNQFQFLASYVEGLGGYQTEKQKECLVEVIWSKVNQFQLMSHLFWGLWGKIMAFKIPKSEIFDYQRYSQKRLETYFRTKEEILQMEIFTKICD